MSVIKSMAKGAIAAYYDYHYQKWHKEYAFRWLKAIESEKGKLSGAVIKRCDEYAVEVLGWKGYARWLYAYSAVAGEFREGWITEDYYEKKVIPKIKHDYYILSNIRPLATKLFDANFFPDIACYSNGFFTDQTFKVLPPESLKEYLFSENKKIVYKTNASMRGEGVHIYTPENFDPNAIKALGNGVFQGYIEQHEFFDQFSSNSVATLRVTSVVNGAGKSSLRAAYLRLGRDSDDCVLSKNAVKIPIDATTGELQPAGYMPDMSTIDKHPDTHVLFEGKAIPNFGKMVAAINEQHAKMPFDPCIGWDVAIDKNEKIRLIEWNGRLNGIKFSEATTGPCFKDLGWENLWRKG